MLKRAFDIGFSALVLLLVSPVMAVALFLVWRQDGYSPLYKAPRVARGGGDFTMVKIRSMRVGSDKTGLSSTSANDNRVTAVGRTIRRFKLDELSQFWNVLKGDMSVVGPRPQVRAGGVDDYTAQEMRLLTVRPGITDLSSIVFSDEGDILAGADDVDRRYNRLIRPWKSRLGLLYIDRRTVWLDLRIVWLTGVAIVSKARALAGVARILAELDADTGLRQICLRRGALPEGLPPGAAAA